MSKHFRFLCRFARKNSTDAHTIQRIVIWNNIIRCYARTGWNVRKFPYSNPHSLLKLNSFFSLLSFFVFFFFFIILLTSFVHFDRSDFIFLFILLMTFFVVFNFVLHAHKLNGNFLFSFDYLSLYTSFLKSFRLSCRKLFLNFLVIFGKCRTMFSVWKICWNGPFKLLSEKCFFFFTGKNSFFRRPISLFSFFAIFRYNRDYI